MDDQPATLPTYAATPTASPPTLGDALALEPFWLMAWVMLLVAVNLAAAPFTLGRSETGWRVRPMPLAILAGFVASTILMNWLYARVGYVRLLGLAHLVGWMGPYLWVLLQHRRVAPRSAYGVYLRCYMLVAGTSLVIDAIDVVRYLLGDGQLL